MMRFRAVGSLRLAHLMLTALVCTGLAACGGSGGSASTAGTTGGATSASSPADPAVTLSWSPPTRNSDGTSLTNLAGYTLHYGTTSEDYTGSIEITSPGATSYVVSDSSFPPGKYYFAISAYNAQQVSSSMSGEISVTVD